MDLMLLFIMLVLSMKFVCLIEFETLTIGMKFKRKSTKDMCISKLHSEFHFD